MAVSLCTLTGNFGDLIGAPVVGRDGKSKIRQAFVESNLPAGEALVDTEGNEVRLGRYPIVIANDGSWSVVGLIRSDSGSMNITSGTLQYRVVVETKDYDYNSGWLSLTSPTADVGDLVAEQAVPASFLSTATAELQALVDAAEEITGLTGEDEAIAYLLSDPDSATSGALDDALDIDLADRIPAAVADSLADDDTPALAAAAAVEAALLEFPVPDFEDTDADGVHFRYDTSSEYYLNADEPQGIYDTKIEGALPTPLAEYGLADVSAGVDGHNRLTSTLTSGPDYYIKGDSIGRLWGERLRTTLLARNYAGRVLNYSVGGENTPTILARTGGSPFLAEVSGGSIPASGSVSVNLTDTTGLTATFTSLNVPKLNPLDQAPDGFNPCYLVGDNGTRVRGIMTGTGGVNPFTFTRLDAGSSVAAAYASPVVTWAAENTMHGVQILAVGQNDNNDSIGDDFTYTERFDLIQQFIDRMPSGVRRYLILTPFSGGPTTRLAEETEATRRWGRRAVLVRPWLSSYASLAVVGVTPTSADIADISAGNACTSYLTPDPIHPNAFGQDAINQLVINRSVELGWMA